MISLRWLFDCEYREDGTLWGELLGSRFFFLEKNRKFSVGSIFYFLYVPAIFFHTKFLSSFFFSLNFDTYFLLCFAFLSYFYVC